MDKEVLNKQLFDAVSRNEITKARKLIKQGAEIDAKSLIGHTPLHSASQNGHREIAALLIKMGAEVNAKDYEGWSPLHDAAEGGHTEVAALLISAGAEVNAGDVDGYTPLHRAVYYDDRTKTVSLLIENGADLHAKNNESKTALDIAREYGEKAMVTLLENAQAKADSDSPSFSGRVNINKYRKKGIGE